MNDNIVNHPNENGISECQILTTFTLCENTCSELVIPVTNFRQEIHQLHYRNDPEQPS